MHEMTHDRPAFVGLLEGLADWPARRIWGFRAPDEAEIERIDSTCPRPRAVVSHADPRGLEVAQGAFQAVLVTDPLWTSSDVLYDAWHRPQRSGVHAARTASMLAPILRLAPRLAEGSVHFVPDWLPGSWEPMPFQTETPPNASPAVLRAYAMHRAARLVYWADRLDATAVCGDPDVAPHLRVLASTSARLTACGHEHVPTVPGWTAGEGMASLPDVSLALIRAFDGRPLRAGLAGIPIPLRRPARYLVPMQSQSA
jgi:hypothetical protein